MRDAVDFLLSQVERHGDTQASEKAKQHRLLLAQEAEQPSADATGHPGGDESQQIELGGE